MKKPANMRYKTAHNELSRLLSVHSTNLLTSEVNRLVEYCGVLGYNDENLYTNPMLTKTVIFLLKSAHRSSPIFTHIGSSRFARFPARHWPEPQAMAGGATKSESFAYGEGHETDS